MIESLRYFSENKRSPLLLKHHLTEGKKACQVSCYPGITRLFLTLISDISDSPRRKCIQLKKFFQRSTMISAKGPLSILFLSMSEHFN